MGIFLGLPPGAMMRLSYVYESPEVVMERDLVSILVTVYR